MKVENMLKNESGSILLEVFIAIAVISIAFAILLDIATLSVKTSTAIEQSSQANFLLKESLESARNFRDGTAWITNGLGSSAIISGNPYHFILNTNTNPDAWILTAGEETIGIFTRKIVFSNVSRNPSNQNIETVYNPANNDPNTKQATATVSWLGKTLQLVTYFTNWK